jgi:NADPH:quinone reductase-like Zn-dependent oxidoreductase
VQYAQRRALTPAGTLVLNGGGSPGHVFGPVAGILRAVVVNGLVRERLWLIPHEQKRDQLLTLTGLIEAGKLKLVLDRTYPLADTAVSGRRHRTWCRCGWLWRSAPGQQARRIPSR